RFPGPDSGSRQSHLANRPQGVPRSRRHATTRLTSVPRHLPCVQLPVREYGVVPPEVKTRYSAMTRALEPLVSRWSHAQFWTRVRLAKLSPHRPDGALLGLRAN